MLGGEVTARMDLDLSKFSDKLARVKAQLADLEKRVYKAQVDVGTTGTKGKGGGGSQTGSQTNAASLNANARALDNVSKASNKANVALAAMGKTGQTTGQQLIALQQGKTAFASLRAAAVAAANAGLLDPKQSAKVGEQLQQLQGNVKKLDTALKESGATATKTETSFSRLLTTLTKATFVFLGIMTLKAAIEGVSAAVKMMVSEAARMEVLTIGFTQLYDGAAKAKAMLESLAAFAATTPFTLVDVEQQAMRLKAYGFAADEVIPILTNVGDAASALGTGAEGINRITLALGQMRSAGRMNSRDMLQLTEAFVPAWQYVADAIGTTTGKVRELSEKGLVPARLAIAAIRTGMQRDFGGLMQAQMKTLTGMWSNFVDSLTLAARAVGAKFLPPLKAVVTWLKEQMPQLQAFFEMTVDGANDLGAALRNVGTIASSLGPLFAFLARQIGALFSMATAVAAMRLTSVLRQMRDHPLAAIVAIAGLVSIVNKLVTAYKNLRTAYLAAAAAAQIYAMSAGAAAYSTATAEGASGLTRLLTLFKTLPQVAKVAWTAALPVAGALGIGAAIAAISTGLGLLIIKLLRAAGAWNDYGKSAKEAMAYAQEHGNLPTGPNAVWTPTGSTAADKLRADQDRLKGLSDEKLTAEAELAAAEGRLAQAKQELEAAKSEAGNKDTLRLRTATIEYEQAKRAVDGFTSSQKSLADELAAAKAEFEAQQDAAKELKYTLAELWSSSLGAEDEYLNAQYALKKALKEGYDPQGMTIAKLQAAVDTASEKMLGAQTDYQTQLGDTETATKKLEGTALKAYGAMDTAIKDMTDSMDGFTASTNDAATATQGLGSTDYSTQVQPSQTQDWNTYRSGERDTRSSASVRTPGWQKLGSLADSFETKVTEWLTAAYNQGARFTVSSAFRTEAEQRRIHDQLTKKYGENHPPAADPDKNPSRHSSGLAVDIGGANAASMRILERLASQFGLANPIKNDSGHFQLAGTQTSRTKGSAQEQDEVEARKNAAEAAKKASEKASEAADKLRKALWSAVEAAKELAQQFAQAVRDIGNFAGLFDRPEQRRVGGFMGAARAQIRKLTKYRDALKKLQKILPASVFDEVVAAGTASMDEVIRLARGNAREWGTLITTRQKVSKEIASITMADQMAAGRQEIVTKAYGSAAEAGSNITVNMGGVTVHGYKDVQTFVKDMTRLINKELRAAGLAGA